MTTEEKSVLPFDEAVEKVKQRFELTPLRRTFPLEKTHTRELVTDEKKVYCDSKKYVLGRLFPFKDQHFEHTALFLIHPTYDPEGEKIIDAINAGIDKVFSGELKEFTDFPAHLKHHRVHKLTPENKVILYNNHCHKPCRNIEVILWNPPADDVPIIDKHVPPFLFRYPGEKLELARQFYGITKAFGLIPVKKHNKMVDNIIAGIWKVYRDEEKEFAYEHRFGELFRVRKVTTDDKIPDTKIGDVIIDSYDYDPLKLGRYRILVFPELSKN
jgi:hypothetical protein